MGPYCFHTVNAASDGEGLDNLYDNYHMGAGEPRWI